MQSTTRWIWLKRASAASPLVDFDENPVIAVRLDTGIGDRRDVGGRAGRHLLRDHRGQGSGDAIDDALDLVEARLRRRRIFRIEDRSLRRRHRDRPERALVLRDMLGCGRAVQQERAESEVAGDLGRSLEGHVEGRRHLRRRAGEIDLRGIARDPHRDLDRKRRLPRASVVVQEAFGPVFAVRDRRDLAAQHALRVVHELLRRPEHHVLPVLVEQFDEPSHTELGRGDLGLDVAHYLTRHPRVGLDELPQRAVARAPFVELHALEQHALGEDIGDVDDQPRRRSTDVHVVRRVRREADQLAVVEDRRHRGDVRRVAGTVIGVVVDHDVAGAPRVVQGLLDAPQIGRDGADVHRRRIRFAKRVEAAIEEAGAEILRFPDDRRIGHAVEDVAHLLGDRVQRATDHLQRDRIDVPSLACHGYATSLT